MQEAILLVVLQVQKLDQSEEVGSLEAGKEGVQQQRLVIDVNIVDSDEVFEDLVGG